jgi:hypothetical protein
MAGPSIRWRCEVRAELAESHAQRGERGIARLTSPCPHLWNTYRPVALGKAEPEREIDDEDRCRNGGRVMEAMARSVMTC